MGMVSCELSCRRTWPAELEYPVAYPVLTCCKRRPRRRSPVSLRLIAFLRCALSARFHVGQPRRSGTVAGVLPPAAGLVLTAIMPGPYAGLLALRRSGIERLPFPGSWTAWLVSAVYEEETELSEAIRPRLGTSRDGLAAAVALLAVVAASIVMERAATVLGRRYAVADIVIGGLVLAVVTSLPNAVSAVYLARRGGARRC